MAPIHCKGSISEYNDEFVLLNEEERPFEYIIFFLSYRWDNYILS